MSQQIHRRYRFDPILIRTFYRELRGIGFVDVPVVPLCKAFNQRSTLRAQRGELGLCAGVYLLSLVTKVIDYIDTDTKSRIRSRPKVLRSLASGLHNRLSQHTNIVLRLRIAMSESRRFQVVSDDMRHAARSSTDGRL